MVLKAYPEIHCSCGWFLVFTGITTGEAAKRAHEEHLSEANGK